MQRNKIKVFIFDSDGVVSKPASWRIVKEAAKRLGTNTAKLTKAYNEAAHAVVPEKLNEKAFWDMYAKELNFDNSQRLRKVLVSTFAKYSKEKGFNKSVDDIVLRLKAHGYKLALLSNCSPLTGNTKRDAGHFKHFDKVLLSHEVLMEKPNENAFRNCMKQMHIGPSECVFIDDGILNIRAARKLGIKSFLFVNARHLKKDLKPYLNR